MDVVRPGGGRVLEPAADPAGGLTAQVMTEEVRQTQLLVSYCQTVRSPPVRRTLTCTVLYRFSPPHTRLHQEIHPHPVMTSALGVEGGLAAASGESDEYLMRQKQGMEEDAWLGWMLRGWGSELMCSDPRSAALE